VSLILCGHGVDANCIGATRSGAARPGDRMLDRRERRPLPERGLDEALGLAIGFWRTGFGADVLDAQVPAIVAEGEGFVTTVDLGHDAGGGDAEAFVIAPAALRKATALSAFSSGLIWENATREWFSMLTWTNSQPTPRLLL